MTDHAAYYNRYRAGPDVDDSPVSVTLSDGRVLNIHDYEYTTDPPEVTVCEAWWDDGDGETSVHGSEIDAIMNGPEYGLILAACERRHDEERAAAMTCADDEGACP